MTKDAAGGATAAAATSSSGTEAGSSARASASVPPKTSPWAPPQAPADPIPPPAGQPYDLAPPAGSPTVPLDAAASPASWSRSARAGRAATGAGPGAGPGGGLGAGLGGSTRTAVVTALLLAALVLSVGSALVGGLVGGVAGAVIATRAGSARSSAALPAPAPGSTARPSGSVASIAARALPSVVTIKVKASDGTGTGSGFVVRSDGYLLTNNHVVAVGGGSGTITVEWSNGTTMPATVVGRDASYDLAVIRVKRTGLPALPLADSADAVVGDEVIAVGAPLGLESSVTSGIISALNRPVTTGDSQSAPAFINAIQTDAAINPGNSGGPLLDMSGAVVGINSAIARIPGSDPLGTTQSGSIGVGFSIPSDQARRTASQLISTGKASHPVIGVQLDSGYTGVGVRIATDGTGGKPAVAPGGPAAKAGLHAGDVLVSLDGKAITDSDEFIVAIRAHAVGDTVRLDVRRGSREQTVQMTLQADTAP